MEEALGKDNGAASAIDVFLCYAHEDEPFLKQLEQHLAPLKRLGLITSWHDRDILIDDVALKLLSIPETPRPLKVWTPGVSTTYNTYPYPVTYQGQALDQLPDQLLYAAPPQNVILGPAGKKHTGESNQLSIQVMSTVTASLQFQIQVSYQIGNAAKVYTLTLPQTLQVVFSDASNWQGYILQNGSWVEKP